MVLLVKYELNVDSVFSSYLLINLDIIEVFPTPDSPTKITLQGIGVSFLICCCPS